MGDDKKQPTLISVAQALRVLPVSRESLYRKLQAGELPSYKFGSKKILVDLEEIFTAMRQGNKKEDKVESHEL